MHTKIIGISDDDTPTKNSQIILEGHEGHQIIDVGEDSLYYTCSTCGDRILKQQTKNDDSKIFVNIESDGSGANIDVAVKIKW